ncbi:hypothetical protein HPP92_000726 [Vanilla planifolia]|uniref:GYF domain-containing protein n=1 Tax=Vanilla planifolia TaxID=51239 RepID=A0A835RWZ5_VANPL|nr:hypothetical protein HPP92_000726 [Vanilla planifolia]
MRLIKQLPEVTADVEAVSTEGVSSNEPRDLIASDKIIVKDKGVHCDKSRDLISSDNIILNDKGVHSDKSEDLIKRIIANDQAEAKLDGITPKENSEGHETHVSKEAIDDCTIEVCVNKTGTNGPTAVYVVDIDEDSDEDTANGNLVLKNQEKIWNYMDPSGNVRGPFCLGTLKYWKDEGFFDEDFRIWKVWQSQKNAIPLGVALGLLQTP